MNDASRVALPDDERQHTRRQRIERSRVADPRDADRSTHDRDDVVRRRPGGFVDDKNAVHDNAEC